MEMIGIDLWAKTYVVLKNQKIICTENTLDYIEQQMMRKDEEAGQRVKPLRCESMR